MIRQAYRVLFAAFLLCVTLTISPLTGLAQNTHQHSGKADLNDWGALEKLAQGQTVYFHAWGGDTHINSYIQWVTEQLQERYGITLVHVKLEDTAQAVNQVLNEKAAGRDNEGSVDLIWINGENFASMKEQKLLLGQNDDSFYHWVERLPNWQYVDVENKPTVMNDFTVSTDGLEAPWGMAQMIFYYDTARMSDPPGSAEDMLAYAKAHPGRLTYPRPPDFLGSTFLKQLLLDLVEDSHSLQEPFSPGQSEALLAGLWSFLNELHPHLWRQARAFPQNNAQLRQLFADGELDIGFAFHPPEATAAILKGEFPDTVRSYIFQEGTIGNTHFVAIPYNAAHQAGALVTANFLMSPEAQLEKQKPEQWGDFTVLNIQALPPQWQAAFQELDLGIATLSPQELQPVLPEPHPSWMEAIEAEWEKRYGQ
jgi:putative thiamine transport system substrate-binding protein